MASLLSYFRPYIANGPLTPASLFLPVINIEKAATSLILIIHHPPPSWRLPCFSLTISPCNVTQSNLWQVHLAANYHNQVARVSLAEIAAAEAAAYTGDWVSHLEFSLPLSPNPPLSAREQGRRQSRSDRLSPGRGVISATGGGEIGVD